MNKKRRNDLILITVCLFAALAAFLLLNFLSTEGAEAKVTVDGSVFGTYPLDRDAKIVISSENGTNTLIIENGSAYVENASCPDKLCEKMHAVSRSGESIVCLPNKVVIEITGREDGIDLAG